MVWVSNPRQGFDRDFTSYPRLLDWRANSQLMETFAAYTFRESVMTGIGDAEQLRVVRATPEFFQVVRPEPVVGRLFAATEEHAAVAVLSHGLWQRRLGGQPVPSVRHSDWTRPLHHHRGAAAVVPVSRT